MRVVCCSGPFADRSRGRRAAQGRVRDTVTLGAVMGRRVRSSSSSICVHARALPAAGRIA
eukprot:scaffold13765_cov64-Phaeocystis_antarctica.AAC.5